MPKIMIPPEGKDPQERPLELLLVDDEEGFVHVLANRLGRRGFRVTSAFSGAEAIRALRRQDFDAAVLDLKMEEMDGLEVLKIFKAMDPSMPVIILTGHGSEEAAQEGMALGAGDYLSKPCEIEELVQKIRECVARREVA